MESHKRSIIKAISWRILGSLVTGSLVFIFTGELALAAGLGSIDAIIKVFVYYGHERIWDKIHFGRVSKGEYLDGEGI